MHFQLWAFLRWSSDDNLFHLFSDYSKNILDTNLFWSFKPSLKTSESVFLFLLIFLTFFFEKKERNFFLFLQFKIFLLFFSLRKNFVMTWQNFSQKFWIGFLWKKSKNNSVIYITIVNFMLYITFLIILLFDYRNLLKFYGWKTFEFFGCYL